MRAWTWPAILLGIAGCGDKDTADSAEVAALCVDAPVVTWENFGAGFISRECQACHGSNAENRNGAPEEVTFDAVNEVWFRADEVIARAAGEDATMPPQGGIEADDRYKLEVWLTCAEEGS
ncbi:MAG: hypothetical protein H6739_17425 [Alphaproteobacteria bacterium]|nr:hypothetical protein [Alphaproteobacteria bacterium]